MKSKLLTFGGAFAALATLGALAPSSRQMSGRAVLAAIAAGLIGAALGASWARFHQARTDYRDARNKVPIVRKTLFGLFWTLIKVAIVALAIGAIIIIGARA